MRRPPDAPTASQGRSPSLRMIGDILVSGRLPGAIAFKELGFGSNHITPLFINTPQPGRTTRLPIDDSNVVVMVTTVPSASHTVR